MSFLRSRTTRNGTVRKPSATTKLHLELLEYRSLPSFLAPVPYTVGTNPQAVATADFNGDGKLDLAVANQTSNTVGILLGNGDGTFQAAQNYSTGSGPRSVAVGDFNADGKLDLVTANAGNLSVLPGNGDGTFQAPASIGIGSSPLSVAVGDFNADGKLDLTATSHVTSIGNCYFVPDFFNYGYRLACDTTDTALVSVLVGNGDG